MPARRDEAWVRRRLALPELPARVVIDTDAANEIDDQFAVAWALLSPAQLEVQALHAAPFSFAHRRAALGRELADPRPFAPPEAGMERSHAEIERVLACISARSSLRVPVRCGSRGYLRSAAEPQPSEAAEDLIERALATPADGAPLYVLVLGCPTNVASALLLAPEIAERIVVVWTSGYPSHAPHVNASFNLEQDAAASRLLFDCGVPLVYLPGYHVGAQLRLSWEEVDRYVRGQGALGALLHGLYTHNPLWELHGVAGAYAHSWVIWDLICIAWMIDPAWVPSEIVRTPRLDPLLRWQPDPARGPMREAHGVRRDAIFRDLFRKLEAEAQR